MRVSAIAADLEVASQECNDQEMPSERDLRMQLGISFAPAAKYQRRTRTSFSSAGANDAPTATSAVQFFRAAY